MKFETFKLILVCSGSTCTSCINGKVFYNGGCQSSCPSGYYNSGGFCQCNNSYFTYFKDLVCSGAISYCATCTNTPTCQTCQSGRYLHLGNCVSPCPQGPPGYYANGGVCSGKISFHKQETNLCSLF